MKDETSQTINFIIPNITLIAQSYPLPLALMEWALHPLVVVCVCDWAASRR